MNAKAFDNCFMNGKSWFDKCNVYSLITHHDSLNYLNNFPAITILCTSLVPS